MKGLCNHGSEGSVGIALSTTASVQSYRYQWADPSLGQLSNNSPDSRP